MFFLDKRAQVICDELKKEAVKQRCPVTGWVCKAGNYVTPAEADAAEAAFEPFDSRTMHWYGPDKHYWFRTDLQVPESFDGKSLFLHVSSQIDEWDDGKNPQFLLFLNGAPVQGIDMNHRDVKLFSEARAGETLRLDLQSYTGTLHSEFCLIVEAREIDPEIEGLYWDIQVPLQAFPRLEEDGRPRRELVKVINDTVNLLDLRRPYSEAYYASIREARARIAPYIVETPLLRLKPLDAYLGCRVYVKAENMQKIMGSTRERLLTSLIFVTIKRGRFGFRMPPEPDPVIDVYRPILIAGDGEMLS